MPNCIPIYCCMHLQHMKLLVMFKWRIKVIFMNNMTDNRRSKEMNLLHSTLAVKLHYSHIISFRGVLRLARQVPVHFYNQWDERVGWLELMQSPSHFQTRINWQHKHSFLAKIMLLDVGFLNSKGVYFSWKQYFNPSSDSPTM